MQGGEVGSDAAGQASASTSRGGDDQFRLLVESVTDYAIFLLDPDGIVRSWNSGAERLKGYSPAEIIGRHYATFYPPETRSAGLPGRLLAEALTSGRAVHQGWRIRKDGRRFWADVVITALFDATGTHTGFAKVTRDMTDVHLADEQREQLLEDQRQLVIRLQELDRWRQRFVSAVAHDLQTPVAAIGAFVEFLQADELSREERIDFAERLGSNARALQELIENLRAYSRIAEGRDELVPEPIALRPFVQRLVADLGPLLAERPVTLDVADLRVAADPHAFSRILRNLLGNAARHTPSTTRIQVRARADGDRAVIEVADDGRGIAPELLPRIFDRFERGRSGGTGLGLSIAQQYVEQHGGSIAVESTPGEGATFRFTLPVAG
jgi:PAS domain S-box-containing protein